MTTPRCSHCHGNAGTLNAGGVHFLCAALAALGQPTPSLGDRCPACDGRKTLGWGGVMLDLALGPHAIARSIRAQFPPCPTCHGSGFHPQED